MKPDYVSKRTTSFPILGFLVLLFILQCSLVLAETLDGNILESPASPAPNAEETESEPTSEEPLSPVPTKPEAEDTGRFRRHLDFFGMNLGAGVRLLFLKNEAMRTGPVVISSVQFLKVRLDKLYFNVVEVYPIPFFGVLGGGFRIGYRHFLNSDARSEIRFGGAFGVGVITSIYDSYWIFPISPHFEYAYNMKYGSVGFGLEIPVYFHTEKELESGEYSDTTYLKLVSMGINLYFHFSVGRIELKRREREDLDMMDKNQESGMNP